MARPNILNNPRNINVIVENEEYEQVLKKCQPNGFSAYLRELMRNDYLIKTTELIYNLREEIEQKNLKIEKLQDTILKMAAEVPKLSPVMKTKFIEQSLGQTIYCPSCGIQNIKLKGGKGRKCHGCGAMIL